MGDVEAAVTDVVARATEIATGKSPADSSTVRPLSSSAMGASTGASS